MNKKYYVIYKGKQTGIYFDTWNNVKTYTEGFSNNCAKTYKSEALAREAYGIFRGLNAKIRKIKL